MHDMAMLIIVVLHTLCLAAVSNALTFPSPIATAKPVGYPSAGQPCRAVRGAAPTAAGDAPHRDLVRRDLTVTVGPALVAPDGVLGYYTEVTGIGYNTLRCYQFGYTTAVIVLPQSGAANTGYIGCCSSRNCRFTTTCIDSKAYYSSSACNSACFANTAIGLCTAANLGYCNLFTFAGLGVTAWECDSRSSTNVLVYPTINGITRSSLRTTNLVVASTGSTVSVKSSVGASKTATASSVKVSSTQSVLAAASSTTVGAIATPTNSATSTDSGGLSMGAKIGIGVGAGVGGLLVIAGIIACLVKRRLSTSAIAGAAGGAAGAGARGAVAMQEASEGNPAYSQVSSPGYSYAAAQGGAASFYGPPQGYGAPTSAGAGNFNAPEPGSGYAPQPYAHQPYTPQGYAPQGYAPQGYAPQGYAPQGFAPQGYAPQGYGPSGAEAGTFSEPRNPSYGWPSGAEAGNYSAPGSGYGAGPRASGVDPAYFAAPVAVAPLAAGAALASCRKDVGSGPPVANYYSEQELGTSQHSSVSQPAGSRPHSASVSEMGTPERSYVAPSSPSSGRQEYHDMSSANENLSGSYYDQYGQRRY